MIYQLTSLLWHVLSFYCFWEWPRFAEWAFTISSFFALCETGPIGKPFAMTIVHWRVKCSHSKRLSNAEDISSSSGFAASVGACHPDISWHYRDIYSAVLFPLPSKHGLIFLECTAGEFLLEISLLRVSRHKNPSPTSWPTKVDMRAQRVLIKPVGLWAGLSGSQPSAGLVFLAGGQVHHAVIHPETGKIAEHLNDKRVGSFKLFKIPVA